MKQIEISLIGKYRSELMGIAAIGIILCHAGPRGVELGPLLYLFNLCKVGVPLFFFLSGYGLFFSLDNLLQKNGSVMLWYRKRLLRIFVPYIIWCIPFFIHQIIVYPDTDWLNWLYVFSLLSYWDGSGGVAWFLSVIILLYILAPILFRVIMYKGKQKLNFYILTITFSILYCVPPINPTFDQIFSNMPNLIVFITGMLMGYYSKKNKTIGPHYFLIAGVIAFCMYFLNPNRTQSHMFHVGTLMFLLPILIIVFEKFNKPWKGLKFLGTISLESYLTNGALPRVVALIPWGGLAWLNRGNYLGYTIVIVGGIFCAWLIHLMSRCIYKILQKC